MNKTVIGIIVAVVIVGGGALFAISNGDDDTTEPTTDTSSQTTESTTESNNQNNETPTDVQSDSQTQSTVSIKDFAFSPSNLTVKKGTTVKWSNGDSVQHNVVPDNGDSDAFKGSQLLSNGQSYEFTFNTPGTYAYHCGPHPQMTATVTVTE